MGDAWRWQPGLVSVVVPTYNRGDLLLRVLAGFGEQTVPAERYEVIVEGTEEPDVTTAEATDARVAAERIATDITLVVGKNTVPIDTKKMRPWITFSETADGGYAPVVDTTKIPTLLDGLAKKIDLKPVNATFRTSGSKIAGVVSSKDGR